MRDISELSSLEAEESLLASCLTHSTTITATQAVIKAAAIIGEADFYRQTNGLIWRALLEIVHNGDAPDIVTLHQQLIQDKNLKRVGGISTVTHLGSLEPTAANIEKYAKTVLDYSKRRQMVETSELLRADAFDFDKETSSALGQAQERLTDAAIADGGANVLNMLEAVARYESETLVRRSKGETDALSTGFCDLDEALTGGFHPSQLIVLAARPGMGKSALALNVASNICKNGGSVVYFSLEMSLTQQLDRLFASMGTYTMNEIKRPGELNLAQWNAVHDRLKQLGKYRFDLDTRGGLTPAAVQSKAMMLQAQRGLDLIIIDHIQLMASEHHYRERTAEITEISGRLKQVAMKLHVPILALSQLSRAVEGRGDKVPQLSDLRESGSIEQDADVVMLLWRDSYYSKNSSDRKASLILAKVREGRTGEIPLSWFPQFARFSNGTWRD